jgi:hypothetical protein
MKDALGQGLLFELKGAAMRNLSKDMSESRKLI